MIGATRFLLLGLLGLGLAQHMRTPRSSVEKTRIKALPPLGSQQTGPSKREGDMYRGTSLERKRTPLGPYRRPMPRVLGESQGSGRALMGEVPL